MSEEDGFSPLPGELYEKWPKTATGEPVPPKFLTHCPSTDMADVLLVNMLDAYGIPALILHPGDGTFGKVVLGLSGTGSSVLVPETMLADAEELIKENQDDELQSGV